MATVTLRPNAVQQMGNWGGVTVGTAVEVADNSDATYADASTANTSLILELTTFSLPTNALVKSVTPRLRCSQAVGAQFLYINLYDAALNAIGGIYSILTPPASITTVTDTARVLSLTQAQIDSLKIGFVPSVYFDDMRVHEVFVDVLYNEAPVASGTGPNASSSTTRPTFTWSYTDPEGDVQERYRVKVFTTAQVAAGGFDPNTSTPTVDSGEQYSAATSWLCTADLQNGTTYRAYIFVCDAGSGGRYNIVDHFGPYAYVTIAFDPPATPTITATADQTNVRDALAIQGRDNLLTANQASLETNLTGWSAAINCSIARTANAGINGAYILDVTATGAGSAGVATPSGTSGFLVQAGQRYSAVAHQAPIGFTAYQMSCELWFYDSAGTFVSAIYSPISSQVVGPYTPTLVSGIAPAGAVYGRLVVYFTATGAGSRTFMDGFSVIPGYINLLTNNQSGIEIDATGWQAAAGTITRTVSQAVQGLSSLEVIGVAGEVSCPGRATAGLTGPVVGSTYSYVVHTRADLTPRTVKTSLLFYNGGSFISESGITNLANSTTGWTKHTGTAVIPATTTHICINALFTNAVGSEKHYVDAAAIIPGTTTEYVPAPLWTPGGLLTSQRFEVQRSDDSGTTWASLTRLFDSTGVTNYGDLSTIDWSDTTQTASVYDYEAKRGIATQYRARTRATILGQPVVSDWSSVSTAAALATTGWRVKSPTAPTFNIQVYVHSDTLEAESDEDQGVFHLKGREFAVVLSNIVHGDQTPYEFSFLDEASYTAFKTLRARMEVMLFQENGGDQRWIKFGRTRRSSHFVRPDGVKKRIVSINLIDQDTP